MQMMKSTARYFPFFLDLVLDKINTFIQLKQLWISLWNPWLVSSWEIWSQKLRFDFYVLIQMLVKLRKLLFFSTSHNVASFLSCTGIWVVWFSDSVCHTEAQCTQLVPSSTRCEWAAESGDGLRLLVQYCCWKCNHKPKFLLLLVTSPVSVSLVSPWVMTVGGKAKKQLEGIT